MERKKYFIIRQWLTKRAGDRNGNQRFTGGDLVGGCNNDKRPDLEIAGMRIEDTGLYDGTLSGRLICHVKR
jgi:hypothetical protein